MLLLYWASAVSSIGWFWIIASIVASDAWVKDDRGLGELRNGGVITTELLPNPPPSKTSCCTVVILSILPFVIISIPLTWLAISIMFIFTLVMFTPWVQANPFGEVVGFPSEYRDDSWPHHSRDDYKINQGFIDSVFYVKRGRVYNIRRES